MVNLQGMSKKFTVIKNDDIKGVITTYPGLEDDIKFFLKKVNQLRALEGKKENTYLVINTDEPYANEVIEILKRHGHWEQERGNNLKTYEEFQQEVLEWAKVNQIEAEEVDHDYELVFFSLSEHGDIILARNSDETSEERKIEILVGKELEGAFQHVNTVGLSLDEVLEAVKYVYVAYDGQRHFIWPQLENEKGV